MSTADERLSEAELDEARRYSLQVAWDEDDGVYIVSVPEIPGLLTHGRTPAEAVEMGVEAVATWLAGLRAFDRPIPAAPKTARRSFVEKPPAFGPDEIREIRKRVGVSQPIFAAALNVSPETVRAWEQGKNVPGGSAARLLELAAARPSLFGRMVRQEARRFTRRVGSAAR